MPSDSAVPSDLITHSGKESDCEDKSRVALALGRLHPRADQVWNLPFLVLVNDGS